MTPETRAEQARAIAVEYGPHDYDCRGGVHCSCDCTNDLAKAIAESLAAPVSTAGWQPIATAPKDERHVLLYYPTFSNRIVVGYRAHNHDQPDHPIDWWHVHPAMICAEWPTHWMPLPSDPPAEKDR